MQAVTSYKEEKEAFVSQLQGGSVSRINAVSFTALTTYLLWAVLRNRGLTFANDDGRASRRRRGVREHTRYKDAVVLAQTFGIEFIILVLPLLLACTALSDRLLELNGVLLFASVAILLLVPQKGRTARSLHSKGQSKANAKQHWSQLSDDEEEEDEERERDQISDSRNAIRSTDSTTPTDRPGEPFRVSIDSAAEAAHSSATPPTEFIAPGTPKKSITSQWSTPRSKTSKHRSSPSLARSAAPLPEEAGRYAEERSDLNAYVPRSQPFLTVYRAHMMLMTMICILAVDFTIFPREFAKCETWGTSLMDLGVGSFVFSLGIISALPMLRPASQRFKPLRLQLLRDARRSVPLLLLGSIRVIMVKGVEYPEHISEYGVHWNFFFTLAMLPFFGTLGRPFARQVRFATLGMAFSLIHQFLLSLSGLGAWASSNEIVRDTLVSQNKEGLASLPGYLALFFVGLDVGHYVLPRDPFLAYRRHSPSRQREKTDKLAMVLVSYAVLWWAAYYVQSVLFATQVSRRLANLPYVLWVAAYNTAFLLAYVTVYMVLLQPLEGETLYVASSSGKKKSASDGAEGVNRRRDELAKTPALLDALNTHSFAVFLLANLLTGLVNVTVQTMYAPDGQAIVVLMAYLAACFLYCFAAQVFGLRLRM